MILGIGTDLVEISRFEPWVNYLPEKLKTVFSEQEIRDCFKRNPTTYIIAQRMAVRFAAKEAFYKALSTSLQNLTIIPKQTFSLLFTCRHVQVVHDELGIPFFAIEWTMFEEKIGCKVSVPHVILSLSHEKEYALAFVVMVQ